MKGRIYPHDWLSCLLIYVCLYMYVENLLATKLQLLVCNSAVCLFLSSLSILILACLIQLNIFTGWVSRPSHPLLWFEKY